MDILSMRIIIVSYAAVLAPLVQVFRTVPNVKAPTIYTTDHAMSAHRAVPPVLAFLNALLVCLFPICIGIIAAFIVQRKFLTASTATESSA